MAEEAVKKPPRVSIKDRLKRWYTATFSGISGRWLSYTALVFAVAFLAFMLTSFFVARTYLYNAVDDALQEEYNQSVDTFFASYLGRGDDVFLDGAIEYISNFSDKDQMDVWVINKDGVIVASSSGFAISDSDMPDYQEALSSDSKSAGYSGKNQYGEHIRAVTYILGSSATDTGYAVRYVVSTEQIRAELFWIVMSFLLVFLILMCMIIYPSLYFIRSVVTPIMELSSVTKRIAGGDMNARASAGNGKDELSELARNLNSMADELSSTDKMKNDFISTVSHEMKTPLTAIKGWAETLMTIGDTDPDLTKRGLEVIVDESSRLTGVVEDLLDLSKISNGRLTLKYAKIDLLAELDDTIFVFKDRSMREGKDLSYNAPAEPAPAEGDATRIKQVFVNVLDNAFKYTEQGGSVTVLATRIPPAEGQEKGWLTVQVEDTGCGISAEELPKVKRKFYKSNISVKGSGIGLAVCDEIVKMHGGTLDLQSELGVGTCVTIRLPIDYVEVETAIVDEAVLEQTQTVEPEMENEEIVEQDS